MSNKKNNNALLISKTKAAKLLGIGDGYLKHFMRDPDFPEPLARGPRKHFYSKKAILDYLAGKSREKPRNGFEDFVVFKKSK